MVGLRPPVALWLLKLHDLQAASSATPEASSGPGTTFRRIASSEPAEDFRSNHVPAISADQAKGEAGETGDVSRHERASHKNLEIRRHGASGVPALAGQGSGHDVAAGTLDPPRAREA